MVDSLGNVGATYFDYYTSIEGIYGQIFKDDFLLGGIDFIANCLGVTNVIPNSSACLLSRSNLMAVDWNELLSYKYSSDWITYLRLAQLGTVSFSCKPLNYHRRHAQSVINSNLSKPLGLYQEAVHIHEQVFSMIDSDQTMLQTSCSKWIESAFAQIINSPVN
jgi:hypothetical protein